ncbi:MAG TPA: Xaa-Pro peptidase family protein [Candidatus Goldiibacteriota bacterium]|nr:Xaa-Pro peptidase family protein [Candidatus Goldiibacteriota bacterium]
MKDRISRLSARVNPAEFFFVSNPADIFYLSGFSGTFARIAVTQKESFFITDSRYREEVEKSPIPSSFCVVITKNLMKDLKKITSARRKALLPASTSLKEYLSIREFAGISISSELAEMRAIKDSDEISLIRKAVEINELSLMHAVSVLRPGISEKDLSLEFEYFARKHGADSVSFSPIVAFDSGSAVPHHKTSGIKLAKPGFILIDAGVRHKGYCSDLTRCVSFGIIGARFKEVQKHYKTVQEAKSEAVKAYKNGCFIREADLAARICLKKKGGFDRLFTHSLGHGMGIEVHEPPYVNSRQKKKFREGMIFTCEPGIYMEGRLGIRIEDDYLITPKGPEKLGKLPDGLIIAG